LQVLELDLEVYQGPFDLLFTLILKEEVDICEVSLLEVILAYLEHVVAQEAVDWEGLSEFLVLISSLLELKSRLLLPIPADHEEEGLAPEEAQRLLLARLLEYRKFKQAAEELRSRWHEHRARLLRPVPRERRRVPVSLDAVAGSQDLAALSGALLAVLERRREPDTSHVAYTRVDLTRQIAAIRRLLAEQGRLSFDEAFGREEPMVQAVTLFALLELLAEGHVRVAQRRPFGDITVEEGRTAIDPLAGALQEARRIA